MSLENSSIAVARAFVTQLSSALLSRCASDADVDGYRGVVFDPVGGQRSTHAFFRWEAVARVWDGRDARHTLN